MSDASNRGSTTARGSTGAYAIVLLLATAFIIYGSLFPFEYYDRSYPGGPVLYFLSTWHDWDHRGDLLSNILLYMPFGFFGACVLPARLSGMARAIIITLIGTALSCSIEITQFHDVGRVTSMGDAYANAIGTAVGAAMAAAIGASMRWPFVRELAGHPAATMVLAMFFGYRFYPYVPMIDMHKYWHAVRPMLVAPSLPPGELARFAITWLLIAVIVHSLYGFRRFLVLFPLLCGFEFLGRILVIGASLNLTDIVGAVIAYAVWSGLLRDRPGRYAIVATLFAGMIIVERLAPFEFSATSRDFGWIPFAAFMRGSIGVAMQAFCEKFFQYGGLIWLLRRAGLPMLLGTVLTAALLFITSYAECWLPGRSAEITDAAMALVVGGVFQLLRSTAHAAPREVAPSASAAREQQRLAASILGQRGVAMPVPRRRGKKYAPYVPRNLRGE